MSEIINIDVFGEKFSFKSKLDDESNKDVLDFFLKELDEVQAKLSESSASVPKLVKLLIAVMNIANNYFEVEEKLRSIEKNLEADIEKILVKLN
ncbi:MAG: hypothetical protein RBR53_10335 [Desulforegulaceae bacterium]|nr:hypothetical protein [Desulforegulaceae bacterium]